MNHNYTITDMVGHIVASGLMTVQNTRVYLDQLSKGLYLITFNGENRQTIRFMKQ